ncbi:MAG: 5'-nucleotidase, lipoprotein e(P4) family [Ferruginibacter sp.]|nr:5'-nucleotidase, lipoprotein e(P4) family [Ferruginibacter sp.]
MKYIFLLFGALSLQACKTTKSSSATNQSLMPQNVSLNGKLFTAMFQQRAAEYRALCLQGYNIARLQIDNYVATTTKPKALITDIDETILDNSPYAVHQAYLGKEYEPASWYQWTDKAIADTMPGAASFLNYAASKNIEIIYITNREERERASTLKNLQYFGLPNANEAHLFTKTNTSSKEPRRQQVMQQFEIVLLMGDNLADLSVLFDKKNETERKANTDLLANQFGKKLIVFPNANYGDWENSLYKFNYKLSQTQKDSVLKSVLINY